MRSRRLHTQFLTGQIRFCSVILDLMVIEFLFKIFDRISKSCSLYILQQVFLLIIYKKIIDNNSFIFLMEILWYIGLLFSNVFGLIEHSNHLYWRFSTSCLIFIICLCAYWSLLFLFLPMGISPKAIKKIRKMEMGQL